MSPQKENHRWEVAARAGCVPGFQPLVSGPKRLPVVKLFIIYESGLNRDRAQLMQEELLRRLGQSLAFSISWWSLESLECSETRKSAARSIGETDIICFSLLSGGEVPEYVTTWLDKELLQRKTPKLCLVALVETGGIKAPRLSRAEVYLSQLSLAAGVDCLCYSDSIPIARFTRGKRQEKQPAKWTRSAMRAVYAGDHGNQEFLSGSLALSSQL